MPTYTNFEQINLKNHPQLNEKWVQEQIAANPKILGLGDLILKDKERRQPTAGRLDLLFQDVDAPRRYEVELQLGQTDPSHIIRTIEYWDIERKRYRQYDHVAVIIAEDITSRFLNVISLFNGAIPIVALRLAALQHGDEIGLVFTKVLDQTQIGEIDDEEEVAEVTDRAYWEEQRGSKKTVADVDALLSMIHEFDNTVELKYNKFYIGLARDGVPDNFVLFKAQKKRVVAEVKLARSEQTDAELDDRELNYNEYGHGRYRLVLTHEDIEQHREYLIELFKRAHSSATQ